MTLLSQHVENLQLMTALTGKNVISFKWGINPYGADVNFHFSFDDGTGEYRIIDGAYGYAHSEEYNPELFVATIIKKEIEKTIPYMDRKMRGL